MRKYFRESSINVGKANSVAYDAYEGISIIKSFNIQNLFYKRFTDFIDISYLNRVKAAGRLKFIPVFNIIIWLFPYITCLIYGSYLTINKEISIGQLLAFFYLINNIVGPVSSTPNIYSSVRNSMGTAQRFFEILDGPAERSGGSNFDIHGSEMCARFKYVSFSYDGDEVNRKEILHNLCFDLKKGSKTALVGKSGCGKSTTLKLLMGYYDNFQGEIELFGRNIKDWSIEGIRSKISYVSQDTFLFPLSIYENIRLGKTNATRVEVEKAAKYANAHEFIMQFPNGYDTEVGERGIRLSGGQKQRISLARAFLRNAPIIILDEPTSALDNQSESLVMEAVHRLISDRSLIVVTHRLSFIKDADNILVLDNGKIAESGTHEQLISKGNLYSELYNRQINQTSAID
jgi:ABC-type multidrug transport system fused ATPase/permease subunit